MSKATASVLSFLFVLGHGLAAAQGSGSHSVAVVWEVDDPETAVDSVLRLGLPFHQIHDGLATGPSYDAVNPGVHEFERVSPDGVVFRYTVLIPEGYNPRRPYPVHVFLHGGVRRPAPGPGGGWWRDYERMRDSTRIAVFPAGWDAAIWWGRRQVENLAGISRELRQRYNVDENRFYLIGISDGGSGLYYHAFRASTIWAAFLPYIGHPAVLNNPRSGAEGDLFVANLRNRPFFIVNGERDRLYPTVSMVPFVERFREAGVEIVFRPQQGGHDMIWYPDEAENIASFIATHPRDPLPDRISWETERTDRYQRHSWLIITELGTVAGESSFPDYGMFPKRHPSGRVEARREGNTVELRTSGIRRLTLLLSPDEFEFDEPILVRANGIQAFEGVVQPSVATMVRWAARDRDRTALFGVELPIEVPAASP